MPYPMTFSVARSMSQTAPTAPSTKEKTMPHSTMQRPIHRATLANGLRIAVVHDPQVPVVALDVTYDVGSRDETDDARGFAHLFEHLMFAGSEHVAVGELSEQLSRVGGHPNASTDFDITHYHVSVPTGALELALWLEADRMGGMLAALDQRVLDVEREIVKNERRQTMEIVPFGLLWEELHKALFPVGHPFHWLPIGCMTQLEAARLDDVRDFFRRHYAPDNAVLTLVGDVEPEHGIALVERYFGGIPANGAIPPHPATAIGPLEGEVRVVLPEPMPVGAVITGHRIPGRADPAWPALVLAADLLGRRQAGRLGRRLMLDEPLTEEVWALTEDLPGDTDVFVIGIWLTEGADLQRCEQLRDEEVARLGAQGPDDAELAEVRAVMERKVYAEIETRGGLGGRIGREELRHPGADPLQGYLQRFASITPEQVATAVRTWLTPQNRAVIVYEADDGTGAVQDDGAFGERRGGDIAAGADSEDIHDSDEREESVPA